MPAKPTQRGDALAGLFADAAPSDALEGARLLPLALIDANTQQARQTFDEAGLAELADSIRQYGVLQPIVVRPVGTRYQVIAGERRVKASREAKLTHIPALVREDLEHATAGDVAWVTATENLQREDLDIEDEARQFAALLALTGLSQPQLAMQLGIRENYLAERVRVLHHPDLMQAYRDKHLTWKQVLMAISERRQEANYSGNSAAEDSTLIERHDLQPPTPNPQPAPARSMPSADPQYFRWVTQAFKAINHIQPHIISPAERPLWAQQLADLEERARELRQALES